MCNFSKTKITGSSNLVFHFDKTTTFGFYQNPLVENALYWIIVKIPQLVKGKNPLPV